MRRQVRTLVQRQLSAALEDCDVLVSPVAPTAAFRIGERSADPLAMYKGDLMTVPINLAGAAAIAGLCLPVCDFVRKTLAPVALTRQWASDHSHQRVLPHFLHKAISLRIG